MCNLQDNVTHCGNWVRSDNSGCQYISEFVERRNKCQTYRFHQWELNNNVVPRPLLPECMSPPKLDGVVHECNPEYKCPDCAKEKLRPRPSKDEGKREDDDEENSKPMPPTLRRSSRVEKTTSKGDKGKRKSTSGRGANATASSGRKTN